MLTSRNKLSVVGIPLLFTVLSLVNLTAGCSCKFTGTKRDDPHCGSDGNIYRNLCLLNCQRLFKPIHVKKMEFCQLHSCRRGCLKTRDFVCGSDGKTYRNPCFFKCNQKRHHNKLEIVKQGRCLKRRTRERAIKNYKAKVLI